MQSPHKEALPLLQTVQVAVNNATFHFDKLYTYIVPQSLWGKVLPGSMVLVPFGRSNKPRMAVVLAVGQQQEAQRCKELFDAAPEEACLTDELLKLVYFLKERTFCTYYEAVKAIIPYGAQYKAEQTPQGAKLQKQLVRHTEPEYRLVGALPLKPKPTVKQQAAVQALQQSPLPQSVLAQMGISRAVLDNLCDKGVLEKRQVDKVLDLFSHIPKREEPIQLSEVQQAVYQGLCSQMEQQKPSAALLYGVTASGKTLVFLKLIERALQLGKTALVLVPEISLTPQMIRRLKQTFGARVAVQHSALNHTERLLQWQMIQQGGADIVVGTRSAVFAPLKNIGVIILDEEQEHTYRSESAPRFDAREVAKYRAMQHNAMVLFASATPSVESYQAAQEGRYTLYKLTQRYANQPLPTVEMVDMKAELAAGNPGSISALLAGRIQDNLSRGNQTILLLNRRGYKTVGMCSDCGKVFKCDSCSVPMVYHKSQNKLMCHYCGKAISPVPTVCPDCGGKIRYTGFGTQRVEEELAQLFPTARILRMDQDSTSQKNSHETMLSQFAQGEYDIMLGTQMVAKGLDFEKVTLVGVLGIDSLLFSQGFRAFEAVFSLVTQVIGRGGRAKEPGHAIIQTVDPNNPTLNLAASQSYEDFFNQEIVFRKICLYPPFCSVCIAAFSGEDEGKTMWAASRFAQLLAQQAQTVAGMPLRILGPAPMNVVMVKNRYRYKLTIKCRNNKAFRQVLGQVLARYSDEGLPGKAAVTLDFNSDGD